MRPLMARYKTQHFPVDVLSGHFLAACLFGAHFLIKDQIDATSVTRLGDLLDFGQLFKAFGNN